MQTGRNEKKTSMKFNLIVIEL